MPGENNIDIDLPPWTTAGPDPVVVVDTGGRILATNAVGASWGLAVGNVLEPTVLGDDGEPDERTFTELVQAAAADTEPRRLFTTEAGRFGWWTLIPDGDRVVLLARDVTRERERIRGATRSEDLLRAVLRTAVDPIVLIDETGLVLEVNDATEELFGWPASELVGRNVTKLMPEPFRSEHAGYLERYLTSGEPHIIGIGRDVTALRADGTTFPVALAVSEVVTPNGRVFTGVLHDLTERVEAERRLTEANDVLESRVAERTAELRRSMADLARSNRDLEQFAYIASHDLQTPLRNVRQGMDLLDEHLTNTIGTGFDDEALELKQLTSDAVGRMERLIQALLSYSRVQGPQIEDGTPVDLDALADLVVARVRPTLDDLGGRIELGALPTVRGHATMLEQLLQNLVENAIKYRADDRPPVISIAGDEADGTWRIAVADNGVGIDAAHHERVFELFKRAHAGYDGVGIGLALCQRIVERHGGTISVHSEPGDGATFIFTLPIIETHDA